MTGTKNIANLARKWQKMAAMGKRTILSSRTDKEADVDGSSNSPRAQKGHFAVYTNDQKRFEFPLVYLNNIVFQVLLKLSEEEFGLSSYGPITLPCDAVFMDYIVSHMKQDGAKVLERDFLSSVTASHCTFSDTCHHRGTAQRSVVCGY